jgi:4-alpha-glucanotransferase
MHYKQLNPAESVLYSSAFTKNIFARPNSMYASENSGRQLVIRVLCPRIEKNQNLLIAGNCDELGNWNPQYAGEMYCTDFPEWEIRLDIDNIPFQVEYKFIIADKKRENCLWESGGNRFLSISHEEKDGVNIISEYPFRDPRPRWKGAGTVIPVFSLRSEQSFGIGDLHDLKLLIDWAKQTNQRLIQILPMNDTNALTLRDSYPYNAISIYALNPIYISISDLGALKNEKKALMYQKRQEKINKESKVCYHYILKHKKQYCRFYFEQEEENILNNQDFQSFCQDNRHWLEPYAIFCFFRDQYGTADFNQWNRSAVYDLQIWQELLDTSVKTRRDVQFTCFLQFVLHTQFKAVTDYAREQGVVLKGDLPIGISRTSVEAWIESSYFNFEMQAGAPPDFFSSTGQTWSFPTYNWSVTEEDGYTWWKKRFRKLSDYFDAFRIDHILGFFRIWEVPHQDIQGLCGHFRPAVPLSVE